MFRNLSLTLKMLVLTALVGLIVWAISDAIQTHSLKEIFNAKLARRFSLQAEEQRIMFDRYVKGHHQAVKLFTSTKNLHHYLTKTTWAKDQDLMFYRETPPWLPKLSIMRNFLHPRYVLLLDSSGKVREVYTAQQTTPPASLIRPSEQLLSLSQNQGFLTTLDGAPFLIASKTVVDANERTKAILMLASPLDDQFLIASQGPAVAEAGMIALLTEDESVVMVSSNHALIPPGTNLDALKDRYLITGQGFFDYGATDIVINLASFISTEEVWQLTQEVLMKDRRLRGLTALAFVLAFVLIMFLVTRRIQQTIL